VVHELDLSLDDYRASRVLQPITGFRTGLIDAQPVETDYATTVSYAIRRCEFDDYLLRRSGVRLELGWAVSTVQFSNDGGWRVTASRADGNGAHATLEATAPMLVGAGGHFCPIARAVSPPRSRVEPIVAAQEVEFEMSTTQEEACLVSGRVPEIYLSRDLAGYGWMVRKDRFLNVGFGRLGTAHLKTHVAAFVESLDRIGRLPPGTPRKWGGHSYLLYDTTPRPFAGSGVLLVGDAAGLAYGQSGEGIRPAIESGLIAAETIMEAHGDYGAVRLHPYADRLTARFGVRRGRRDVIRLLPAVVRDATVSRLLASRWFSRRFLLDRWFLHRDLLPLAAPARAHSSLVA
jgi:flavin-dependent dehydrogenase